LVEELKIGDWVEVIGPALGGSENGRGKIFKITQDTTMCTGLSAAGMAAYPRESLRKLTPEEMQPIKVIPTAEGNAKRLDAHREEIDAVNERLSVTEKKLKQLDRRIDFIEAFQKDEATRSAYTTYTYKPDDPEHGTITVNCSCGRKYELEATPRACYSETKLWI
jgi:hypothetical protein